MINLCDLTALGFLVAADGQPVAPSQNETPAATKRAGWNIVVDKVVPAGYADKPQIHIVEGRVTGADAGLLSVVVYTRAQEGGNLFLQQNEKGPRMQLVNPQEGGRFAIAVWLGNRRENAERYEIYAVLFHQLTRADQRVLVAQTSEKTDQIEEVRAILNDRRVGIPVLKVWPTTFVRVDHKTSAKASVAAPAEE